MCSLSCSPKNTERRSTCPTAMRLGLLFVCSPRLASVRRAASAPLQHTHHDKAFEHPHINYNPTIGSPFVNTARRQGIDRIQATSCEVDVAGSGASKLRK